jgi:hypothetical protein
MFYCDFLDLQDTLLLIKKKYCNVFSSCYLPPPCHLVIPHIFPLFNWLDHNKEGKYFRHQIYLFNSKEHLRSRIFAQLWIEFCATFGDQSKKTLTSMKTKKLRMSVGGISKKKKWIRRSMSACLPYSELHVKSFGKESKIKIRRSGETVFWVAIRFNGPHTFTARMNFFWK